MRVERSAYRFAALCVVMSALAASVFAQRDMRSREWALTHIPDEINKHFKKEKISLFEQIREDFTRLQVINNEMMCTIFEKRNVDRKLIAATTAEINKRALRLSANLALPEIDDKTKKERPDPARNDNELQAGLLELDRYIVSFTGNPLFKQPEVVDSQSALKARSDLNFIIRLSEQLKRSRDK